MRKYDKEEERARQLNLTKMKLTGNIRRALNWEQTNAWVWVGVGVGGCGLTDSLFHSFPLLDDHSATQIHTHLYIYKWVHNADSLAHMCHTVGGAGAPPTATTKALDRREREREGESVCPGERVNQKKKGKLRVSKCMC